MKKRIILELKKFYRFYKRLEMTLERHKKYNLIYKSTSAVLNLKHPSIAEAKKYWKKYKIRINPKWHAFCASLNNIQSSKYIPEDVCNVCQVPLTSANQVPETQMCYDRWA